MNEQIGSQGAQCVTSDGSTASYYELPEGATELQHLISAKNMNAQIGEIFRESYRYGEASHCTELRGIRKIKFYAAAEEERLLGLAASRSKQFKSLKKELTGGNQLHWGDGD